MEDVLAIKSTKDSSNLHFSVILYTSSICLPSIACIFHSKLHFEIRTEIGDRMGTSMSGEILTVLC